MTEEAAGRPTRLAAHCLSRLRVRGETLATAESLTAGLISSTLAAVPGASDVLRGGIAAYATDVKTSLLGVPAEVVERHGVVSAECAEAMAARGRVVFDSDWVVAATGVAGPDEQEGRPAGTVYVAVAGPDVVRTQELWLEGDRRQIRSAAVAAALSLLRSSLT